MSNHFKTEPLSYQSTVFSQSKDRKIYALLWDMGLGKSKIALDTATYLYDKKEIDSLIIICRKSALRNWTDGGEIAKHLAAPYSQYVWRGGTTKREQADLAFVQSQVQKLRVYAFNIEAWQSEGTAHRVALALRGCDPDRTLVVLDEATDIKAEDSIRTRAVTKMFVGYRYKRILTGTPLSEKPVDVFALYRFLSYKFWESHGYKNYWAFKNYFCVYMDMRLSAGRSFKKLVSYRNLNKLSDMILNESISSRLTTEECLPDLKEVRYMTEYVSMSTEQAFQYKSMKKDLYAALEDQELELTSKMHRYQKLHQITSGVIHMEESALEIPGKNPKIERVKELIADHAGKVIVFSMLRSNKLIEIIERELQKEFGVDAVVTYTGKTDIEERQKSIAEFQDPASPVKIFLGNQAASHGITLTAASLQIYISNDYSLATRLQSEKRAHRLGQEGSVTIVDIVAEDTEDIRITKALRNKEELVNMVMREGANGLV